MLKNLAGTCGFCMMALAMAAPVFAGERVIVVTGDFSKQFFFPTAFGSSDPQLPLAIEIVVEDTDPNILPVAAGFPVGPSLQPLAEDVILIPASAITSFNAAIGNGSWGAEDLKTSLFFSLQDTYAVAITGSLSADGTGQKVSLSLLDFNVGELEVGESSCSLSLCDYTNTGTAEDYLSAAKGSISNVAISIDSPEPTSSELLSDLTNLTANYGFNAKLLSTINVDEDASFKEKDQALTKLNAYIKILESLPNQVLSESEAADLIGRAQALIDSL